MWYFGRERRDDLAGVEDLLRRRRALVEVEHVLRARLDAHPDAVHPRPREQLELVLADVVRDHPVDGERQLQLVVPQLRELLELAVRDRHEAVVVEGHLRQVREARAGVLDLVDHVARARVADALVLRVVGDELRVAAVRAVKRAADRPQRRVAEAVVEQVVLDGRLHEALPGQVDLLVVDAVLRERQRLHLLHRHQRQEVVLDDLLAAVAVGRLEPEVLRLRDVAALLEGLQELLEGELALAGADGVDVAEDRVLGLDDRVDAAPDHVRRRVELAHAPDDAVREVGVAGHRGEADQVGVLEALRDLVDLLVGHAALVAHPAHRGLDAAVALGRDVAGLRAGLQLVDVRGHLAKAAGRDAVLEAHHLGVHGVVTGRSARARGRAARAARSAAEATGRRARRPSRRPRT